MTVVETIGGCTLELTSIGFIVTRDGGPVPPQVHPPALLAFFSKTDARAFAQAVDVGDTDLVHELVAKGRWFA